MISVLDILVNLCALGCGEGKDVRAVTASARYCFCFCFAASADSLAMQ